MRFATKAILLAMLIAGQLACGPDNSSSDSGGAGGAGGSGASGGAGGSGAASGSGGEVVAPGGIPTAPQDVQDCSSAVLQAASQAKALPDYGASPTLTSVKGGKWS